MSARLRKKWEKTEPMVCGAFRFEEKSDLSSILKLGAEPVYSCVNAMKGVHRKCLFGYADYAKHILWAYDGHKVIGRAILRVVKYQKVEGGRYYFVLMLDRLYTPVAEGEREPLLHAFYQYGRKRADDVGLPFAVNGVYYPHVPKERVYVYVPYSENGYQYTDGFGRIIRPENCRKDHPFILGFPSGTH